MYRERAARLQKLFLVHNRMGTWKDKKNTLFIPFSEAPPEARVERAMDGMGASHLTQKRFLILHLWKARAHTCTSTHPRPLPESQFMFCFVSVSQEKQEGRFPPAIAAWLYPTAAGSRNCRAIAHCGLHVDPAAAVGSEGQDCLWACHYSSFIIYGQETQRPGELQQGEASRVSTLARYPPFLSQ